MTTTLLLGDCLNKLKELKENSIDAVVTDPPYGLSFMNKHWDYDVPSVEIWKEVWRVLKPGGHLLSFGGTRTYHRMVVNIEDAGFEIRDQIQWIYGSGFPKSLDISKAIDKEAGAKREVVGEMVRFDGKPAGKIKQMNGGSFASNSDNKSGTVGVTQPATDAAKQWSGWGTALKPANEPIVLARKPLSEKTVAKNVLKWGTGGLNIDATRILSDDKRPTICESCEKNQESLFANSAEKKTGRVEAVNLTDSAGLSVEETRSAEELTTRSGGSIKLVTCDLNTGTTKKRNTSTSSSIDMFGEGQSHRDSLSTTSTKRKTITGSKTCSLCESPITSVTTKPNTTASKKEMLSTPDANAPKGRFPSNLILDEEAAEILDAQSGKLKTGGPKSLATKPGCFGGGGGETQNIYTGDTGGASRFFYCAKASKRERNAGLGGMPEVTWKEQGFRDNDSTHLSPRAGAGRTSANQNHHPTVKPISLMRYLVRLITPPNGIVLDPFMGSGTTGLACKEEKFQFIGIERDAEYFKIAEKRI